VREPFELPTAEGVPVRLQPAGLGSRLAAAAVDALVQLLLIGGLFLVGGTVAQRLGAAPESLYQLLASSLAAAGAASAVLVVIWTYPTVFELIWRGQTPGKRALGLQVVADDGGAVGLRASLTRNLLRPADLLPGVGGLGILVCWVDPMGRRIGDLVAGTLVVYRPPPSPRPALSGAALELLPPRLTPRRVRVALGPELLTLAAETLERRHTLDPEESPRVLSQVADSVRQRLGWEDAPLSDPTLLATVLAQAARD
jgi:uncharacterized RDD family membrane protein YckC